MSAGTYGYSLSYRDLEEITVERGLSVDHVTIWRWVQRFAPILNQRLRRELRRPNRSWRVDEAYVRVAGSMDVPVSSCGFRWRHHRFYGGAAAKLFLHLALSGSGGVRARVVVVNVDGHPAYVRAIAELKNRLI